MVEVVAALIQKGGRFLICKRPPHKARGLLWEFCRREGRTGRKQKSRPDSGM